MAEKNEIYKCNKCGIEVEILHKGDGVLTCCEKPMTLKSSFDGEGVAQEHIPKIEDLGNKVKVVVGALRHPMTDVHHIEWIEIIMKDGVYRKDLKVDSEPEVEFNFNKDKIVIVREYCNIHGLWEINLY